MPRDCLSNLDFWLCARVRIHFAYNGNDKKEEDLRKTGRNQWFIDGCIMRALV